MELAAFRKPSVVGSNPTFGSRPCCGLRRVLSQMSALNVSQSFGSPLSSPTRNHA